MDYLRKFMMRQSQELQEQFSDLLLTFLSSYNVMVWNLNYNFSSYIGSELLNFIENVEKVKEFLVENFVETPLLEDLCNGLLLWKKLHHFL